MAEFATAPNTPERAEKRRLRQLRLLRADVSSVRLGRFSVTVRNVSEQGIGGKAPVELNLGERVHIDLPGLLPLAGTVRWTFEGRFGVETDKPIALEALRSAYGDKLPAADQSVHFQVMRPSIASAKRPALSSVRAPFGQGTPVDDSWNR